MYSGVVLIGYNATTGRGSVYLSTPKRTASYTATIVTDGYGYWGNASHTGITFGVSQFQTQCIRVHSDEAPANSSMYVNGIEIRVDAEL